MIYGGSKRMAKKKVQGLSGTRDQGPPVDGAGTASNLPSWMRDVGVICCFTLVLVIFFWPIITGRAFFWEDFIKQMYPFRLYNAVELRSGQFPFWSPYLFGGIPYFAMIDTAVLYPLDWLFILFVKGDTLSYTVVELQSIAHLLLYGSGVYFLCRNFEISRPAACVAGISAMFSGRLIHQMFNTSMLNPYAWYPWVVLFFFRAIDRRSLSNAIIGGFALGVAILAGHTQIVFYLFYSLLILFLVTFIYAMRASEHRIRTAKQLVGLYAIINLVGIGLAAVVLLPAYELVNFTARAHMTFNEVVSYSFHPQQLITFFMPDFFGKTDPFKWQYWGPEYNEYGRYWETYGYIGIAPLVFSGCALFVRRGRIALGFGLLGALAIFMALGINNPLYQIFYELIPGFSRFRIPARTLFVFGFAASVLTGLGVDVLFKNSDVPEFRLRFKRYLQGVAGIFGVGIISFLIFKDKLLLWLAGDRELLMFAEESLRTESVSFLIFLGAVLLLLVGCYKRSIPLSACVSVAGVLTFSDLYLAGNGFNQGTTTPDTIFYSEDIPFIQARQQKEGGRVAFRNNRYLLVERNAGLLHRVYSMEGYTSPLRLSETVPPRFGWELMNVTYHVGMDSVSNAPRLVKSDFPTAPAFIARHILTAKTGDAVAKVMADSMFNYQTTVVLEDPIPFSIPIDTAKALEKPVIERYTANEIDVKVSLERPGVLVMAEVYYPAWKVTVDGVDQKIYRANQTMRAVPLRAGNHRIVFRYESATFKLGSLLSLVTILCSAACLVWCWRGPTARF